MLCTDIEQYCDAGFPGIWVSTVEPDEAQAQIVQHASVRNWRVAVWDAGRGLDIPTLGVKEPIKTQSVMDSLLASIRSLDCPVFQTGPDFKLFIVHNLHMLLKDRPPELVQCLFWHLLAGKGTHLHTVVLSPTVEIPVELEKVFVVVDHALPNHAEIREAVARGTGSEGILAEEVPEAVVMAASGLTGLEAENAAALSWSRLGTLCPTVVNEIKAGTLKKTGAMELWNGGERFADIGGLEAVKDFALRSLKPNKRAKPRGIMLLGVAGTGKSAFAKALGNETGRPTVFLKLAELFGQFVGQTEQQTKRALATVDAMAPCILFVDEIEKGMAGVGGGGDSGVSDHMMGTFLSWLNDHTSDVYVVCTGNNINILKAKAPEFLRAERFDAIFFLDTPNAKEKDMIWNIYLKRFQITGDKRPDDTDWTGAEIRACCRLAALLDVPLVQAARNIVPIAVSASQEIEALRNSAAGRWLSASAPGIYQRTAAVEGTGRGRRVVKGSDN